MSQEAGSKPVLFFIADARELLIKGDSLASLSFDILSVLVPPPLPLPPVSRIAAKYVLDQLFSRARTIIFWRSKKKLFMAKYSSRCEYLNSFP